VSRPELHARSRDVSRVTEVWICAIEFNVKSPLKSQLHVLTSRELTWCEDSVSLVLTASTRNKCDCQTMTNCDTKPNSANCYLHGMHDGDSETKFILFISKVSCKLSAFGNSQSNGCLLFCEATLQDVKVGVWCAISAAGIIGPIFCFLDTKFTQTHNTSGTTLQIPKTTLAFFSGKRCNSPHHNKFYTFLIYSLWTTC